MGSRDLAFQTQCHWTLSGFALACILQTGCNLFPVSAKPLSDPPTKENQSRKMPFQEAATGSFLNDQLAVTGTQTDPPNVAPRHFQGNNHGDSNQPTKGDCEVEECPVLEVASKVFPETEKPLVSSGVILADLTKPNPATGPGNADHQNGALGIPPLNPPSPPPSTAPEFAGHKSQESVPPSAERSLAKATLENLPKSTDGSSTEPAQTTEAETGVFRFTKLILCKRVDGFGQYEPISPGYRFCPGSAGFPGERVLLYGELASPPGYTTAGTFRTKLSGEVEILRQNDPVVVCKLGFPGREDCSRTPRKDHHLVYSFHVPPGLPPGKYTLRVNARDCSLNNQGAEKNSGDRKQASAVVDFELDVGRGQGDGARDKTLLPAAGVTTK